MEAAESGIRQKVAFLVWRDTRHPEGGGSEVYVEHMASGLAERGHEVTIVCARHDAAPDDEVRAGVLFRRRGGRLTVYVRALLFLLTTTGRRFDVVIDVQNGLPFWSPLVRRRPIIALVHHLHKEQWQVIYPGWSGRLGWWLESRVAPVVYRSRSYVTVSQASADGLIGLGIAATRIEVVYNGLDDTDPAPVTPAATPTISCVGRLVPHKQFEHALEVIARLRPEIENIHLDLIGDGWWSGALRQHAQKLEIEDAVTFHGHVVTARRDELVGRSWVMLVPSIKEGWGIVVMEAAAQAVPAIAYHSGGGVSESIIDGITGVLVDQIDDLVELTRRLLLDPERRTLLGKAASDRASHFGWELSKSRFVAIIVQSARG
jgi:glycosyltransferase involved in cell wall biosynthesis